MRIIAGEAKGRRLATPEGRDVRPTSEKIREALFGIIGSVAGAVVVDGFAGTGAIGCEALSRGAAKCYFFEPLQAAHDLVRENVALIDADDRAEVIRCTFGHGLRHLRDDPDLVFLDPPYGTVLAAEALGFLGEDPHITQGALVVVEQASDEPELESDAFERVDIRDYSGTRLTFFRAHGENESA